MPALKSQAGIPLSIHPGVRRVSESKYRDEGANVRGEGSGDVAGVDTLLRLVEFQRTIGNYSLDNGVLVADHTRTGDGDYFGMASA